MFFFTVFSQAPQSGSKENNVIKPKKAAFNQYRIITLQKDTTYVDTSLNIKKEYEYNYLRKDIFGLLPFANEGQTYAVLNFGLKKWPLLSLLRIIKKWIRPVASQ